MVERCSPPFYTKLNKGDSRDCPHPKKTDAGTVESCPPPAVLNRIQETVESPSPYCYVEQKTGDSREPCPALLIQGLQKYNNNTTGRRSIGQICLFVLTATDAVVSVVQRSYELPRTWTVAKLGRIKKGSFLPSLAYNITIDCYRASSTPKKKKCDYSCNENHPRKPTTH